MAKSPNTAASTAATVTSPSEETATIISNDLAPDSSEWIVGFFADAAISESSSQNYNSQGMYSDLIRHLLKAEIVERGLISCLFSVLPFVTNYYNGLHGGAVAAIAERVAIACARTVVSQDKELFLGELGISYLSAAPQHEDLVVDASIVRSGRNLTVIAIEFKMKKTGKLVYTARATFYHMPTAKL